MRIYNKAVKRKIYCLFCLVMGKKIPSSMKKAVIVFVPFGGWNEYFKNFSMPIIVEDIGK